jgi:DNA replicative helicase MCM subunit Mcm2 (Cdc46/Mcm family)
MRQVITTQEDLFAAVDKHLADDSLYRHILLLADSGMGKSSFVLNYYARNQELPTRKRQRLA